MTAKPHTAPESSIVTVAVALSAAVIALSILWVVVLLFQSRGAPMERLVEAERACAHYPYRSEQQACVTQWFAESQTRSVAAR